MYKSILSGSFNFDAPVAAVMRLCKSSIDKSWMTKRASALFDFERLQARPNETLVHLLALGDGEVTGANRNSDFFPKAANVQYHKTFLNGHYFHNHDNKDPAKAFGRVAAAEHNPRMGRVELVVGLDNEKCAEDLQELETHGEFPVSMSCLVPYDECSIKGCHNKAKSRKDYCKHASEMMGRILDDGQQVYVINRHPNYFDISRVWRGADRVAYTFGKLQKAAAEGRHIGGAELFELFSYGASKVIRTSTEAAHRTFGKLARAMQKWGSQLSLGVFGDEPAGALKALAVRANEALEALNREAICLSLPGFLTVTGMNKNAEVPTDSVRTSLLHLFMGSDPARTERVCQNGSYDQSSATISQRISTAAREVKAASCVDPVYVQQRAICKVAAAGLPTAQFVKTAGIVDPRADVLAEEYAAYLVSFARRMEKEPFAEFRTNLTAFRAFA